MKFIKKEYHQMISYFNYDLDEDEIADKFGSVERFLEIASHESSNGTCDGEEPSDEEIDTFWQFMDESDYDREDDIWTDRKGGYDVDYELDEDDE